ncbi:MAG: restriction endonuclease subunit S [Bacteroidales bacterium]|nr:restriction endonuclease subunit S [Bacteroidales bacterium]
MTEWKETELQELTTKIGSGATPRGGANSYKSKGISLIRSQNVLDMSFSCDGLAFIDEETANGLRNVIVEQEDVLLNITGDSVARVCKVPKRILPARVNQHVAIIRANQNKLNPDFLLYNLIAQKEELLSQSEIGATRRAITKGMIEKFQIIHPPLPEQRAIASILSSLDDKIDLLHRQNKTLEEMAEALFRQWFVEEANEDWEVKPLNYFGNIICGKTPTKKKLENFGGNILFIKIPDMHGKVFVFDTTDTLSVIGKESQINKTLPPWSINISCIATVGLVTMNAFEAQTNQQINSIIPDEKFRYYLYYEMKNSYDLLQSMASGGTATLNLNTGNFSRIEITLPDEETLLKFNDFAEPIVAKLYKNQTQIRILEKLRDTLLPKLMSGETRIEAHGRASQKNGRDDR